MTQEAQHIQSLVQCSFAWPGTYGHECNAPASVVGFKKSNLTKDSIFYARRCPACAEHEGCDNADIYHWETFDPEKHINQWR